MSSYIHGSMQCTVCIKTNQGDIFFFLAWLHYITCDVHQIVYQYHRSLFAVCIVCVKTNQDQCDMCVFLSWFHRMTGDVGLHQIVCQYHKSLFAVTCGMKIDNESLWCFGFCFVIVLLTIWASYQIRKIADCAGNAGNVFPATDIKGNR